MKYYNSELQLANVRFDKNLYDANDHPKNVLIDLRQSTILPYHRQVTRIMGEDNRKVIRIARH